VEDLDAQLRALTHARLSRRRLIQYAGAVTAAGLVVGCGETTESPSTAAPGATTQPGGEGAGAAIDNRTVVVADTTTPQSLDYNQSEALEASEANANLHANWIQYAKRQNPAGFAEPDVSKFDGILAEEFSSSPDGLTHSVKLRQGLMSEAGNELTTDDVVYMFERHFATGTTGEFQVRVGGIESPDQIKVLDRYNFEVRLPTYNSIFWDAMMPAIATTMWDSVEAKKNATADDPWSLKYLATNAPGWGAYRLQSLDAGREMVYKANPDFALGAPGIDKIIYRVVPESSNRLALLESGEIDVAKALSPREYDQARANPALKVVDVAPGNIWIYLYFNNGEEPFSANPDVRRALSMAIPYDDILKTVFFGKAATLKGPMAEIGQDWCAECWDQNAPKTDMEQAKKLLADAGFSNGFSTGLAYNGDEPEPEQIGVLIQSAFAQIGVQVELNRVPSAAFAQGKNEHSYPMFLEKNYLIVNRGAYEIPLMWTPGSPINWANYEADDYGDFPFWDLATAGVSEKDPEKAREIWDSIQTHLISTAAQGFVAAPGFHVALKKNLAGYTWDTDNNLRWRFMNWA